MNNNGLDKTRIAQSILKKLIYFDIFSHPLLPEELISYCNYPNLTKTEGFQIIDELISKNLLRFYNGFYYLGNDSSIIAKRTEANNLASLRMKAAKKYAWLISKFPYVRAVFISGSLSKNVMKPDSDIDFFIITKPSRLWLCRASLTIFKKIFLGNSRKNFCLNYFIDSNSLEIPDKNLFTATEIAFILPMFNYSLYMKFMAANKWYQKEYPNMPARPKEIEIKPSRLSVLLEFLLNNPIGNQLDQLSFSVISGFWRKKFSQFSNERFSLNLRSLKNISKHHPNAFQEKVLNSYSEKILSFEQATGYNLG